MQQRYSPFQSILKYFMPPIFQETGVLVIFDEDERDSTYDDVLKTIGAMSNVVDRLYQSAQKLT